jgi:hypothetical protein
MAYNPGAMSAGRQPTPQEVQTQALQNMATIQTLVAQKLQVATANPLMPLSFHDLKEAADTAKMGTKIDLKG